MGLGNVIQASGDKYFDKICRGWNMTANTEMIEVALVMWDVLNRYEEKQYLLFFLLCISCIPTLIDMQRMYPSQKNFNRMIIFRREKGDALIGSNVRLILRNL